MTDATAAQIAFQCTSCDAWIRGRASRAGKRGKCPKCGEIVEIPSTPAPPVDEAPAAAEPTLTDDGRIKFACDSCRKSLGVPADAVGRRLKCPKCQSAVTVPDPNADASENNGDEDDMFAGIATGNPVVAPVVAPPPPSPIESHGPKSGGTAAGATAVLGAAGAVGGAVANPVLLCILGSALGAAIGGAIWCGVAYYTHVERGWIALAVGALSGFGAILGARDSGSFQALVATGMSALGIIGGKFAVFYLILQPFLAALNDVPKVSRDQLANLIAQRAVEQQGISMEQEAAWDRAMAAQAPKAEAEVAKLSDEQVQSKAQELASELRDEVQGQMKNVFWKAMFTPYDFLFFAIALAMAFRIGSGVLGADR